MTNVRVAASGIGCVFLMFGCSTDSGSVGTFPSSQPHNVTEDSATELEKSGTHHVTCGHSAVSPEPSTYDVLADAVAFPSITGRPALQAVRLGNRELPDFGEVDHRWYWAKDGLITRSTHKVEVLVPKDSRDSVRFGWSRDDVRPHTSIVLGPCPESTSEWQGFIGGYWVEAPGCYEVHVRVDDGGAYPVEVGIGAPCPGQDPPPPADL